MKRALALTVVALAAGCSGLGFRHQPPPIPMGSTAPPSGEAKAVLAREGFVMVTPAREEYASFHLGYSAVFRAHQPVFVTADAVLHAWHQSYDTILARVEAEALVPALQRLLGGMSGHLAAADPAAREDVARYLAVAGALLSGTKPSDTAAAALVGQIEKAAGDGTTTLFGSEMKVDFSMFKPRGHYAKSELLSRYFRAMSWLGRIELRIAEQSPPDGKLKVAPRALAAVRVLRSLMTPAEDALWHTIDETIAAFVGPPDSMSIPTWDAAAKTLGANPSEQQIIDAFASVARQRISTQLADPGERPLAFVFLGQRYVFDSHVLSRVSYGELATKRMMPSPLDVAATVFENPTARKQLAPEIAHYGNEYARALDAMVVERRQAGDALWHGSLYHLWLDALRELGEPDAGLPDPFRGDAWGRRLLNTQLASWAELRHDNIFYAKQSVSAYALCDYPDGYVDPYPRFWSALEELANKGRTTLAGLALPIDSGVRERLTKYFTRFHEVAGRLRLMAERERRNEPLTRDDLDFLNRMVSIDGRHGGCTVILVPEGWFADLYFDRNDALWLRPTIADVHTQPTDEVGTIVGKVLHVGTSYPRTLIVTVAHDGGAHTRTYRGFVSSYAEKTTEKFARLDDQQWQTEVLKATPKPPEWLADVVR